MENLLGYKADLAALDHAYRHFDRNRNIFGVETIYRILLHRVAVMFYQEQANSLKEKREYAGFKQHHK